MKMGGSRRRVLPVMAWWTPSIASLVLLPFVLYFFSFYLNLCLTASSYLDCSSNPQFTYKEALDVTHPAFPEHVRHPQLLSLRGTAAIPQNISVIFVHHTYLCRSFLPILCFYESHQLISSQVNIEDLRASRV